MRAVHKCRESFWARYRHLFALIWVLLFCIFSNLTAYDLYVNPTASPIGADGSSAHPYNTIQAAVDHAFNDTLAVNIPGPAVRILLEALQGVYLENITIDYFMADGYSPNPVKDITIEGLGTEANECVIQADSLNQPAIFVISHGLSSLRLKSLMIDNGPAANVPGIQSLGLSTDSVSFGFLGVEGCRFENLSISLDIQSVGVMDSLVVANSVFINPDNFIDLDGSIIAGAGGSARLARITDCVFTGDPAVQHMVYATILGEMFEDIIITSNLFNGVTVCPSQNNFSYQTIDVSCNRFDDSLLTIKTAGNWNIFGNEFIKHTAENAYPPISLRGGDSGGTSCTIQNNLVWGYDTAAEMRFAGVSPTVLNVEFFNNSFVDCDTILVLQRLQDMGLASNAISAYQNNLYHGSSGAPFQIVDQNDDPLILTGDNRIPVSHCVFSNSLTDTLSLNLDMESVYMGDPCLSMDYANYVYSLIWTDSVKSLCINNGYQGVNNELTDPDGTPPDIGCVYYPHYNREYFERPSLISWLSFPVLDDRTETGGSYWNELGYMFNEQMQGPPESTSQLNTIQWSYGSFNPIMRYYNDIWENSDERVIQPKGYKVQFNQGQPISSVVVNGFKADPDTTPAIWIESVEAGGQSRSFENWIGYFVPFTQRAGDALSRMIPGSNGGSYLDHVYSIQTRTWCARRLSNESGSRWINDPNTYTLSEGEMASLMLIRQAPEEMYWNTEGLHVTPIVRPPATAFAYEEKLDYIPIFIEFDPQDMPDEVGLFVDGICKGAAVVDSSLIDVCFYNDVAKDEAILEIMFYYEGKGKKAATGWKSYNPDSMVFEDIVIRINEIGSYAYLSFYRSEGDSPVPLVTELQPNYPNPFNPSTTISFILSRDMNARLDIFNVRGQKVITLLDYPLGKGKHTLVWSGKDESGRSVSSGIYFSRLNTTDGSFVNKMMLVK